MATLGRRNRSIFPLLSAAFGLVALCVILQLAHKPIRTGSLSILTPLLRTAAVVHETAEVFWLGVFSTDTLRAENEQLREELAAMQVHSAVERSAEALASIAMQVSTNIPAGSFDLMTVSVLSAPHHPDSQVLWIDGGTDTGLKTGMVVLGPGGIIGSLELVKESIAMVRLITDRRSAWGAEVDGKGEIGFLRGTNDPAVVEFVFDRTTTTTALGDSIVTSGMEGSIAPGGVVFGLVEEVGHNRRGEPVALVRLAHEPLRLRTVFVLPVDRVNVEGRR